MERRMNVADFAALVGTTAKTIYKKIENYENLPVNEQLTTVKDRVNGREIALIVTSDEQIAYYKNLYSKETVSGGEYYNILTNNNGQNPVNELQNIVNNNSNNAFASDAFDKLMTLNETYLNRIETVTNELMEYKSKTLLLEDKASREGMYLNNIKELETENNKLKTSNKTLVTVLSVIISVLLTVVITLVIVNNKVNTSDEEVKIETAMPVQNVDIKKGHASK